MKKILVLGGTQFIGRYLVEELSKNPEVEMTLFNRGKTGGDIFPAIARIIGDRGTDDVKKIAEGKWDFVIDLSCYFPDHLLSVLENLEVAPERYVFVSTCSVYDSANDQRRMRDEDSLLMKFDENQRNDASGESYGGRKVECERIMAASGFDHVVFRPALVYGPYDHTDRFYYWLYQVKKFDQVLYPDKGERVFSITYVGDLVEAIIKSLDRKPPSTVYNVISTTQVSIGKIIEAGRRQLGRVIELLNADPDFLKEEEISQWMDMPLWIDSDHFTFDNARVKEELGIQPRDFDQTVAETIAYYEGLQWPVPQYGITEERKRELMDLIRSNRTAP